VIREIGRDPAMSGLDADDRPPRSRQPSTGESP
jgi:hypothetical protein